MEAVGKEDIPAFVRRVVRDADSQDGGGWN